MKTTAAVLGSILLSLPSYAAPSVKGIAAYCGQFKDYNQQQQCFQDEAQTAGKEIKERCKRFCVQRINLPAQETFYSLRLERKTQIPLTAYQ
jgi:hypothetical protein